MNVTNRLALRPLRDADADWIAEEIVRPEVQRWLPSVPHPYGLEDAHSFVAKVAPLDGYRVIEAGGVPGGVISITELQNEATPNQSDWSLGYWLKPAFWNQGYMTMAARTMVTWHFAQSDTPLQSGWIEGNTGSENVLTKLGFVRTGVVKNTKSLFHGRDVPVIKVQLDQPTWLAVAGRGELD